MPLVNEHASRNCGESHVVVVATQLTRLLPFTLLLHCAPVKGGFVELCAADVDRGGERSGDEGAGLRWWWLGAVTPGPLSASSRGNKVVDIDWPAHNRLEASPKPKVF